MISQHSGVPPTAALTDQCTDQCIVITCHDPHHVDGIPCDSLYGVDLSTYQSSSASYPATTPCPGDNVCLGQSVIQAGQGRECGVECNSLYIDPNECADCVSPYFDEFLKFQCCTDPYPSASGARLPQTFPAHSNAGPVSNIGLFWDQVSTGSTLCSRCGQEPPLCTDNCRSQRPPDQSSLSFDPSQVAGEKCQASSAAEAITCQWGNCQASFSTSAELVGHVNMHHLQSSSLPTSVQIGKQEADSLSRHSSPPVSIPPLEGLSTDPSQFSCRWRNCDKDPPPTRLCPLPYEQWRDLIAVHLFKDHLGIPPDIVSSGCSEGERTCKEPSTSADAKGTDTDVLSTPSLSPSLSSMAESADIVPRISLHTPSQEPNDAALSSEMDVNMTVPETKSAAVPHRCRWCDCDASFETCEELTAHLSKVHVGSGRPIYECFWEGCTRNGEAGFGSRQKINRHLQSHTGHRPFQCSVCHQNFSEAATLQQHMRRHTQEKPYICDHPGCGKSFAIAGALTIHKRTHSGQRPFKCLHCDRAFAESSNLSKHLRTHTGVKPYTCTEPSCLKSFARPDQLNRHLATHRKKARPPDLPMSV